MRRPPTWQVPEGVVEGVVLAVVFLILLGIIGGLLFGLSTADYTPRKFHSGLDLPIRGR